ncbi:MAG: GFA family protein [Burkholderiales bacterium]|nr:GFA family protein [Burkholderiales bacterium]
MFGVSAYFPRAQVLISGERRTYRRGSDAGRGIECYFCPTCGSTVAWTAEVFPQSIGVAVGCFADPSFGAPQRAVWTRHKHDWVSFPPEMPQFPSQAAP